MGFSVFTGMSRTLYSLRSTLPQPLPKREGGFTQAPYVPLACYLTFMELDFERPLLALERQIGELEVEHTPALERKPGPHGASPDAAFTPDVPAPDTVDIASEVRDLRESHTRMLRKIYDKLSPWNTVRVARHPNRPQTTDYLAAFVKDFCQLHGDRHFGDDPAIITGFGRIGHHKCLVIGHHKGKETKDRLRAHFGCAHPEGYRKALRGMKLAEKFHLPVVTLIDTPGAYPGIGPEERGQAEAIAVNLREMSRLRTPIISVVIGEGGSGGALGIGVADRLAMMRYAWYSVISPEGCAAILWKAANPENNAAAAQAMRLTAADNLQFGTIDDIIEEPLGGAHRDPASAAHTVEQYLTSQLEALRAQPLDALLDARYRRLRAIGELRAPAA